MKKQKLLVDENLKVASGNGSYEDCLDICRVEW